MYRRLQTTLGVPAVCRMRSSGTQSIVFGTLRALVSGAGRLPLGMGGTVVPLRARKASLNGADHAQWTLSRRDDLEAARAGLPQLLGPRLS
mmetsp:Transcript_43339/g.114283  ORF Transcript_43339/g.114283 Transcript_43339/m.114283 type:complete len:91 (+) Transcript_43339:2879-3151(+)